MTALGTCPGIYFQQQLVKAGKVSYVVITLTLCLFLAMFSTLYIGISSVRAKLDEGVNMF